MPKPQDVPAAALAESPIYRGGEQLQPWQRSFVTMFLQHRETYGARACCWPTKWALGKTLSLAASAMVSALLGDGPVLILCPSTLTLQWQVELADKLGIPSVVWSSTKKVWLDPHGHEIRTRGPEDVANCPAQIAIVSTGLIFHDSDERQHLLKRKFGTVVLDEAHKARRRGGLGKQKDEPNNLLDFMLRISARAKNVLLGTATPIQTEVHELWDLLRILAAGADFVLGREPFARWVDWQRSLPIVKGTEVPVEDRDAWEWLRNPLPPASEDALFATLRLQLGLPDQAFFTDRGFGSLGFLEQQAISQALAPGYLREHNPIVRHTVLRRRVTLEDAGLLQRVGVSIHPNPERSQERMPALASKALGLLTNLPFDLAYRAAEDFTAALKHAHEGGGLHEDAAAATHLLQLRIGPVDRREDAAPGALERGRAASLVVDVLGATDGAGGRLPAHDRPGAVAP